MISPNQSEASRVNGSQSHGPVTAEGKARSSRNSLKSGLYAKSLIIAGESLADFEALTAEYMTEYQPAAPTERSYQTALRELERLQSARRASETTEPAESPQPIDPPSPIVTLGFVPSVAPHSPTPAPNPQAQIPQSPAPGPRPLAPSRTPIPASQRNPTPCANLTR